MTDGVTVLRQGEEEERDGPFWKVALLALLTIGCLLITVYAARAFLASPEPRYLWGGAASAVLFLALTVLELMFVKSRWLLGTVSVVQALAPLLLFLPQLSLRAPGCVLMGGAVVFAFFAAAGAGRGRLAVKNSVELHFFDAAKLALPKLVTGLLIFLSVLFYLSYFEWGIWNDALGRRYLGQLISSADPMARLWVSKVSLGGTVGEFLEAMAESELQKLSAGLPGRGEIEGVPSFNDLPAPLKAKAIAEAARELELTLEKSLGPLDTRESISDLLYRLAAEQLAKFDARGRLLLGIGLAFLFFVTVKGVAALFHWFFALIAFLLFKFLIVVNFAHEARESIPRKFVVLS